MKCVLVVLLGLFIIPIAYAYNYKCGIRPSYLSDEGFEKRIIGGKESVGGSWPWQVSITYNDWHYCGGSLVNQNWVVTAAHCVHHDLTYIDAYVILGEHRTKIKNQFEQKIKMTSKDIIFHPKYEYNWRSGYINNDVALIKLSQPANLTNYVRPVCLLPAGEIMPPGKVCYITGFGINRAGRMPGVLKEAKVKIISDEICKTSYKEHIQDDAFCAGEKSGATDACVYDSGGPLVCAKENRYYLTGVISWGNKCGRPDTYGVYANMMKLNDWVKKTISKNY